MKDINYKAANWKTFKAEINRELTINRTLQHKNQLEKQIQQITKIIQKAAENNFPKFPKPVNDHTPPEVTETIRE